MFYAAAADHSLLLSDLIYVGDDIRDEATALGAGCTPVIIGPEAALVKEKSTESFPDLLEAIPVLRAHYRTPCGEPGTYSPPAYLNQRE